ncbi:MAG: class I SAM-dependent methyltransferase [Candidatus Delongbacteria bacterium]|jgi:S-adenosylmethionine-dependent methyltransferase|nr:class I SAM-dependent methyltransferase [Candidatus Delongbacteria bacterium]
MEQVKEIYEKYDGEYNRLIRHRMEFYINLRYINENIPGKNLRILDLGGGVGRYSVALTKEGHEVTLIDLSEKNLEEAHRLCREEGVNIYRMELGNALDLSSIKDDSFDIVLAMGPFYHIKEESLRIQCINEIKRVLKNDGKLFSAHLSKCAFFKYIAKAMPEDIDKYYDNLHHIIDTGIKKYSDGDIFTDNTYCENSENILEFMGEHSFSEGQVIASEGLVDNIEDNLQELKDEYFEKIAELNYRFCKDPHAVNAASHLLYKGVNKK